MAVSLTLKYIRILLNLCERFVLLYKINNIVNKKVKCNNQYYFSDMREDVLC